MNMIILAGIAGIFLGMGISDFLWEKNAYKDKIIYGGNNRYFKVVEITPRNLEKSVLYLAEVTKKEK